MRSNREVILCAGGLGTPFILQHSGVDEAEHLASLGIQPVVDLPQVARNLQDDLFGHLKYEMRAPAHSLNTVLGSMPRMALEALR